MKARYHFLVAVIVLVPLVIWESPSIIIPFLLGSVLIDCDHEIDFFIMKKRITFSVTELSKTLEGNEGTYLPLHSYEAIIISAILMHWHIFFFGIYFGLIIHILSDILTNGFCGLLNLSFIYRVIKNTGRV